MKISKYIILPLMLVSLFACSDDEEPTPMPPTIQLSPDQTVSIESMVTIEATVTNSSSSISWNVTAPDGSSVDFDNSVAGAISFRTTQIGSYSINAETTNTDGTANASGQISVENVSYQIQDQMGRAAINTVFNYFGDADVKNGYNATLPSEGGANSAAFKGIFDALQGYIGLNADDFVNILGLDNATTAGVLAVDVLNSDLTAPSSYGTLNGRQLSDDVVDITLLLAFNDTSGNTSPLIPGLISDNVGENDKAFSNSFPYLASPH